jgi:Zn-dependent peptidase ImmA (M78 family)
VEKLINKLINELLDNYQITEPPVDVKVIAEKLKIIVVPRPYKDKGRLSGMLVRNEKMTIIGVNESHTLEKQRFSIAHELGHYFLHKGEELIVDKDFEVNFRDYKTKNSDYRKEKDANLFASSLLIPEKFLIKDLQSYKFEKLSSVMFEKIAKDLHNKYFVSLIAMRLRLYSLLH